MNGRSKWIVVGLVLLAASAALWLLGPLALQRDKPRDMLGELFPGASVSVGGESGLLDPDGIENLRVVWPGGDSLAAKTVAIVEEVSEARVRIEDFRFRSSSGLEVMAASVTISGMSLPPAAFLDVSAGEVEATGVVVRSGGRYAMSAERLVARSIEGGVPLSLDASGISFLAPGSLEVAFSIGSLQAQFDPYLRSNSSGKVFPLPLEESLRLLSASKGAVRLAREIPMEFATATLDLRPVLGLEGELRRGTVSVMSGRLGAFAGNPAIERSVGLKGREMEVEAVVERTPDGHWSIPEFSLGERVLGSLSGSLGHVFSGDFSGRVVYVERTLFQRVLQGLALSRDITMDDARREVVNQFSQLFGKRAEPVFEAFIRDLRKVEVSWEKRPEPAGLRWRIPDRE